MVVFIVKTDFAHVFLANPGLNCGCDANVVAYSHIFGGSGTARCVGFGRKGSKGSTWQLTCSNGKTMTATMGKRCTLNQV